MSSVIEFFLWQWTYIKKGMDITNEFKYVVVFLGLFDIITAGWALVLVGSYVVFCWLLAIFWHRLGIWDIELDIMNKVNPFQKEVRKKLGIRKI